ncbi:MAG TPA: alpha-1,4-glucan--maltose-1-phosphate maltosyltransferase [Chloroflexota bacterium]|nr:alpha-1,4-glucan--maltose-1-phosphate maltosyltransferase [Chloroflexota bacterium]
MEAADGTRRVVIEGVKPEIDAGRFPIKRTVGEQVVVEADLFADGHDALSGRLLYRRAGDGKWSESPLEPLVNDRWRGAFRVTELGSYGYTLEGWVDRFKTWTRDLAKRVEAEQDVAVELLIGAALVEDAATRATGADATELQAFGRTLRAGGGEAVAAALSAELGQLMARHADRGAVTRYERELPVTVDRERARFSTWYELFPRSTAATKPGWRLQPDGEEGGSGRHPQTPARGAPLNPRGGDGEDPPARGAPLDPRGGMSAEAPALPHGTLRDVQDWLPYVAAMGFDVLYLPPIHPIGRAFRKGRNNALEAAPGDPGSPWAIGGPEGGHKAIHPELGTLDDFRELVERARGFGLEVALDVAFQCSPDHPYVREHPEWFRQRPDGTIQYAENPPKKYQDIYPFDFECADWRGLWDELKSVVCYWIEQGVRIFRVDNPHTKPFRFWEWLIGAVKREYPETIFLAEAFTRPKVMYHLAKLGFTQSYTYFAWRNTKWELTQYFTELTQTEVREYFRPNLWPNTPDILTEALQMGQRSTFMTRLVLAATLGASYGIYGPAFELGEHEAIELGKEEYLNSEKYEIKRRDLEREDSLRDFIARVNRIRRENPALHSDTSLQFVPVDNEQLIAYTKESPDRDNLILTIVNLDPHYTQAGWVDLPLDALGIDATQPYQVHDLLGAGRYLWNGPRNYVELSPQALPAHIMRFRRRVRTEEDFEYFA